ncbi:MAG TPA: hypothetical protein VLA28_12350 [Afifellaceae bacterium]|nr:hypothetical protein [Afifellaceae bacterium]
MPDYASILQRSIETLPEKTPDMRQAVYERARAALARQLTSVDPPLAPESIELQHQHLEDAIVAVEAEFLPPAAGGGEDLKTAENGGISDETTLPDHDEPADYAVAEDEPSPVPGSDDLAPAEAELPEMAQIAPEPSNKRWKQPKASHAPAMIMLLLFALIAAGAAVFAYTQWETFQAFVGDLTGEQDVAGAPSAGGTAGEGAVGASPESAGGDIADRPKAEDRLLEGVAAPLDNAQATMPAADAPDTAPVERGVSETAGETRTPATGDSGDMQTVAGETAAARAPAAETPATAAPEAKTAAAAASAGAEPAAGETPPGAETAAGETPVTESTAGTETVDAVPQGLVGQRAIFEEQGEEGAPGKSVPGVVAWSQRTKENELPAIVGIIDLPDRNAAVSLTITKNTDEALPASHLIEIEFRGSAGLIDSPLERVPALFLKKNVQGRGTRLTGEAVPVTENLYWIALSDQGDQVRRNLAILREGIWFSLPMLFRNGRGALLTFEKGIPGDQVFEAVLAGWDEADADQ